MTLQKWQPSSGHQSMTRSHQGFFEGRPGWSTLHVKLRGAGPHFRDFEIKIIQTYIFSSFLKKIIWNGIPSSTNFFNILFAAAVSVELITMFCRNDSLSVWIFDAKTFFCCHRCMEKVVFNEGRPFLVVFFGSTLKRSRVDPKWWPQPPGRVKGRVVPGSGRAKSGQCQIKPSRVDPFGSTYFFGSCLGRVDPRLEGQKNGRPVIFNEPFL